MDGFLSGYVGPAVSYAIVAIGWLAALFILNHIGLTKYSVLGPRFLAAAAIFSLFTSVFQLFAEGISTIGQTGLADITSKAAIVLGGGLSWVFGVAGSVFLVVSLFVKR